MIPPQRAYETMTWDAAEGYVLMFGGCSLSPYLTECSGPGELNDTWSFDGGMWSELFPSMSPPPLAKAAMAYDSSLGAVLMFGGELGTDTLAGQPVVVNSTWEFVGGDWSNETGIGAPSPRVDATLSADPDRAGVVLFGGLEEYPKNTSNGTRTAEVTESDTWMFGSTGWVNITAQVGASPSARFMAGMDYDPAELGALLFGGWTEDGFSASNETWLLNSSGWRNLTTAASPPAEGGMGLSFVTSDSAIVMFGGTLPTGSVLSGETWSFSGGSWTELSPTISPPGSYALSFADVNNTGYAILLLGNTQLSYAGLEESWTFQNGGWSPLGQNSTAPPAGPANMVYDSADKEIVLVTQGYFLASSPLEETWIYANSTWTELNETVAPPSRASPTLVYDDADGYVLYFGGTFKTDTWTFQSGLWTQLFPAHHPAPALAGSAVFDSRDGYVLYFDSSSTWIWSAGDWTNLNITFQPDLSASLLGPDTMVYDAADGYVLLSHATNQTCPILGIYCLGTWTFSGGQWTNLSNESTTLPPPLLGSSEVYDSEDQSVLLFGGSCIVSTVGCQSVFSNETWSFHGGNWSLVSLNQSPSPRSYASVADDPSTGYVLLFGGLGPSSDMTTLPIADTWSFSQGDWNELTPSLSASHSAVDVGVGVRFVTNTSAIFGTPDISYSGLPSGCDPINSPVLTCAPNAPGLFGVTASTSYGTSTGRTSSLAFRVNPLPSIETFSAAPSTITLGEVIDTTVQFSGGTGPFSFLYSNLPPGCASVDSPTAECTPTGSGTFLVNVSVIDSYGRSVNASLQVNVTALAHSPLPVSSQPDFVYPTILGLIAGLLAGVALIGGATRVRAREKRTAEALVDRMGEDELNEGSPKQ
ncbi:MAG: hypothetical protein L3K02_00710 [Thermoplasmata archaeon]|nr:hypothetical protein [Thermoplasmata archaeon]